MTVTLRIGKNQSVWEDGSVDELLRLAFSTRTGEADLQLSVYVVQPPQVDQARVEHLVSATLPLITITTEEELLKLATGLFYDHKCEKYGACSNCMLWQAWADHWGWSDRYPTAENWAWDEDDETT